MATPNQYVVAQDNAFFMKHGTLFAAPIDVDNHAPDWEYDYEVEPQDLEDVTVVEAITTALHVITVTA